MRSGALRAIISSGSPLSGRIIEAAPLPPRGVGRIRANIYLDFNSAAGFSEDELALLEGRR